MVQEIPRKAAGGVIILVGLILAVLADVAVFIVAIVAESAALGILSVVAFPVLLFLFFGLFTVNPNEARVLQLFGRYVGTVSDHGLRWANPLYSKKAISLRVRNFETDRSKVNDSNGNPIEIAAVVVWKVVDNRRSHVRSR